MHSQRLLILSAKAGVGHLRAAAAIEAAARLHFPHLVIRNVDVLDHTNAAFRRLFTRTYERLSADLPSLWKLLYEGLERKPVDSAAQRLNALFDRVNARPLMRFVRDFDPHAVIATHYMAGEILGPRRRTGLLRASLNVVLTDFDIHTLWVQEGVDRYFVATADMEHALRAKGVGRADIRVTGIPIMPVFRELPSDRPGLRRRLGLRAEAPVALVAAGGFPAAQVRGVLAALAESAGPAQILAFAGRNAAARADIEEVARRHPDAVRPLGFVDNMHELMAAADFIITKSGGLTAAECLAAGLPMIVYNPIPGQEERNADFLLESGVALRANSPAHLLCKFRRLLAEPLLRRRMSRAALRAARPAAAEDILRRALDPTPPATHG